MTKTKKMVLWIAIPTICVGIAILLLAKKSKDKVIDDIKKSPLPEPSKKQDTPSDFPLKKGSINNSVKQLQLIIGADPDGNFGPKTEAALKAFAGITQVANQAQLDSLEQKKATLQNQSEAVSRANTLLQQNKNGTYRIKVLSDGYMNKFDEDAFGAMIFSGKRLILKREATLPETYRIKEATKAGNLIVNVSSGENIGNYSVNPTIITLIK